jgi:hypothetical protein
MGKDTTRQISSKKTPLASCTHQKVILKSSETGTKAGGGDHLLRCGCMPGTML